MTEYFRSENEDSVTSVFSHSLETMCEKKQTCEKESTNTFQEKVKLGHDTFIASFPNQSNEVAQEKNITQSQSIDDTPVKSELVLEPRVQRKLKMDLQESTEKITLKRSSGKHFILKTF